MGCSSAGEYCDRSKGLRCRQERAEYLDDTCGDQVGYECYGLYWDTSIEVWADPHSDYVCSDA